MVTHNSEIGNEFSEHFRSGHAFLIDYGIFTNESRTVFCFSAQKTKLVLYENSQAELTGSKLGGASAGGGGPGTGGADEKSRATFSRRSTNMSEHSASGSKQRVSSGGQTLGSVYRITLYELKFLS